MTTLSPCNRYVTVPKSSGGLSGPPKKGDAVLFWNKRPDCLNTLPVCIGVIQ
ncbi:unnamed protein product [Eruca vesicaria subsp. sativa]|uniref:Uncharacterized protein n=1 Tax=Eruca vesicaria subsp. sativa TaxID=29727 RepID=A0ABC8LSJ5_ERUVS|nr:unnamed protein product [Eruca vesicaria subsp. sativa]